MGPYTHGMKSGNGFIHLWYGSGNRFPNHMSTNDNVCLPSVLRIWVELSRSMRL